jgi:hypothetical protein
MGRYHPRQSVLEPQAGQRQTACMRDLSAPQRSPDNLSASGLVAVLALIGIAGFTGGVRAGSDMREL